jgi:hypothetical protein
MSESKLQIAMVKWFGYFYPKRFLCAIPNGGNRSPITGAILKAEGVRAGVADLFLMEASGEFHGLWIEVKLPKGRQSINKRNLSKSPPIEVTNTLLCAQWMNLKTALMIICKIKYNFDEC